jgi:heme O synthase-like polyprenyltransferase
VVVLVQLVATQLVQLLLVQVVTVHNICRFTMQAVVAQVRIQLPLMAVRAVAVQAVLQTTMQQQVQRTRVVAVVAHEIKPRQVATVATVVVVWSSLTLDKSLHLRLVHQPCRELFILLLLVERLLSDV